MKMSMLFINSINLQRKDYRVALSNLSLYYTWKSFKKFTETINLKYQQHHQYLIHIKE